MTDDREAQLRQISKNLETVLAEMRAMNVRIEEMTTGTLNSLATMRKEAAEGFDRILKGLQR